MIPRETRATIKAVRRVVDRTKSSIRHLRNRLIVFMIIPGGRRNAADEVIALLAQAQAEENAIGISTRQTRRVVRFPDVLPKLVQLSK